jgi:hypothetical protein
MATGATASTSVLFGIDYRDSAGALAHVTPADIKSFQGGKSFAIEYIGIAQGQGNNALTAANASALESAGLSIVSVYENRPSSGGGMTDTASNGTYTSAWVNYFSQPGQGTTDAQNAIIGASSAGQLTGAIYFAIDLDPAKSTNPATGLNLLSEAAALNLIDHYFQQISAYFNSYNQLHGTSYQIGVYGAGDTLSTIVNDPLVTADGTHAFTWLAGASSWPGFNTFTTWDLAQSNNDQFQLDGRNVDLDQSSGPDFGAWGSSSAQTIQNDSFGITRVTLPSDQASVVANAINALTQTETQYVNGLLSQVSDTTIPAVAVEGSMYGAVGTSAEVTLLATQFLPGQVSTAIANGFNPQVYASEALGLAFAFGNETGGMAFANSFGPSNAAMPNTPAGDLAFAAAASVAVFGSASTANLVNVLDSFVANWKVFYSSHGVPGIPNATANQIDLAARGAAWGDAVGVALANNLGPLSGQTTNFLEDAAQGTATYSASLASQPNHAPFEGLDVSASASATASISQSNIQLVGISAHHDAPMI